MIKNEHKRIVHCEKKKNPKHKNIQNNLFLVRERRICINTFEARVKKNQVKYKFITRQEKKSWQKASVTQKATVVFAFSVRPHYKLDILPKVRMRFNKDRVKKQRKNI